jgi:hypothetical protein
VTPTIACQRPGCTVPIKINTQGVSHCIARHNLMVHHEGEYWPCPCLGEHMPAAPGWLAGPCAFTPAAQKGTVKKHLVARHGHSALEARDAVAALVPVVRRGAPPEGSSRL